MTHRMAISNHRLLAFDGKTVSFRWRDYAHGSKQRVMTVGTVEFLRPLLPPRSAQGLRTHPPLRPALQSIPKAATAPGPRTARSSRRRATSPANTAAGLRPLALSSLRQRHARLRALHRGTTLLGESRFLMIASANPLCRLAPRMFFAEVCVPHALSLQSHA
jgi:hypothetical protein